MELTITRILILLLWWRTIHTGAVGKQGEIVRVKGHDEVVWVVQLSDLHFSVHHPHRASDFQKFVGHALSIINPSLVLVTGDLTDGKSKDLLTMKQDEEEWAEYQKGMENVVKRSGLNKSMFYDLRGNHDNFGVPSVGGTYDYFSKYSITGQLGRSQFVNSVTLQTGRRNHLFVSLDTTMSIGLRGPTNLFGHPTDQLLTELNSHLSQWDSDPENPLTKIGFGHFPLSFSAPSSPSKKTLKDTFLAHSVTAYLCGHLHARFGKNLKRHHRPGHTFGQLNAHAANCSDGGFWEWEMGDWRKNRAIRILAVDNGRVSFVDTDLKTGAKETFILPTYPLDSRFLSTCRLMNDDDSPSSSRIRALVFSSSVIASVNAKVYDSSRGTPYLVMETSMSRQGNVYTAPWNTKAFVDPSPDRYWLEIVATDVNDVSVSSQPRPFSLTGASARLSWTWKEFFVMGCQWAALYYPMFWSFYFFAFAVLVVPKAVVSFSKKRYTYRFWCVNKGFVNGLIWVVAEVCSIPMLWNMMVGYVLYLVLCPWLLGQVFTEGGGGGGGRGYMTYKGWVLDLHGMEFLGSPDVMVVVLPHLYLVVLPSVLVIGAVAAHRAMYQDHIYSLSGKKDDGRFRSSGSGQMFLRNWARRLLLTLSLAVCWKHFTSCWGVMKAYEMNPLLHFPFYCFGVPFMLAYVFYKTR